MSARGRTKLFVGIELDPRTRAACVDVVARLQDGGLNARFEAPDKLHITLAFLGWVDADTISSIRDGLQSSAGVVAPFVLTLDKIGAFPSERNPHVVYVGAREQGAAFRSLAQTVRTAYENLGFTFGKAAVAHVTIARIKNNHEHLPMLQISAMRLNVNALTLFESLPDARTTRYEVRAHATLQGSM